MCRPARAAQLADGAQRNSHDWDALSVAHGDAIVFGAKKAFERGTLAFVRELAERRKVRSISRSLLGADRVLRLCRVAAARASSPMALAGRRRARRFGARSGASFPIQQHRHVTLSLALSFIRGAARARPHTKSNKLSSVDDFVAGAREGAAARIVEQMNEPAEVRRKKEAPTLRHDLRGRQEKLSARQSNEFVDSPVLVAAPPSAARPARRESRSAQSSS